jgi:hypothetical protein
MKHIRSFAILAAAFFALNSVPAGYDPTIGRWLSRDPIGEDGGTNLYRYVGNNPVNLTDPSGLLVETYYEGLQSGPRPGFDRMIASLVGKHAYVRIAVPGDFDVTLELEGPRANVPYGTLAIREFDPGRGGSRRNVTRPCPPSDYSFEYDILDQFFGYYDNPLLLPTYGGLGQNSNTFANYLVTGAGGSIANTPWGAKASDATFTGGLQIRLQVADPRRAGGLYIGY